MSRMKDGRLAEIRAGLDACEPGRSYMMPLGKGCFTAWDLHDLLKLLDKHVRADRDRVHAAYRKGWERSVRDYATWKDGEQLVGALCRPLKEVLRRGPDTDSQNSDLEWLEVKI